MIRSDPRGFTLVELILVMALLAIVMAFAAPSLSRTVRERNLKQEATRFLALTEYGRDEAVSRGVPMVVWVKADEGRFGVEPKLSFEGDEAIRREYALHPDVRFDSTNALSGRQGDNAIEFSPDGTPETSSIESVRFVDRFEAAVLVTQTPDRWGYEIAPEESR